MSEAEPTREELLAHVREMHEKLLEQERALEEYRWVERALKRRTRELSERLKELERRYGLAELDEIAVHHRNG